LTNGALSHIVEMDDLHRASVVHPAAVVVPAALAAAEAERSSGLEFLAAVVAGYEVAIRVGEAVGKSHYRLWHNTATCGVFGAAAAASRLLGLTAEQTVWALGSAGTMAAGLWQFHGEGAMSKPLHTGHAAASGVLAAELARCGLSGARRILEGERGFFAAMSRDAEPRHVVEGLSPRMDEWRITGVSIKPYPSCRHTHSPIDAALLIRARFTPSPDEIAAVEVETYRAAMALSDNPQPSQPDSARFSIQYCVAHALLQGTVGLGDFTPAAIMDPAVRSLMNRVRVSFSSAMEDRYPRAWPVRVSVEMRDGQTFVQSVDYPKGDPENPLSRDDVEAKFRSLAVGTPWEFQAETLIAGVRVLDRRKRLNLLPAGKESS
jgi:2-methylcitrate dehydratase PrpD